MSKRIRLFWWSEIELMGKSKENFGDLLGKYLVEKISGKNVVWVHPKKWHLQDLFSPIYVTIGSILAQVNSKCIVWGSGVISKDAKIEKANFLAVRGPRTREVLMNLGYHVPEIYGDPAILLPKYYSPEIPKKYSLGIVPHCNDYQYIKELYASEKDVLIIDLMTNEIEPTADLFLQCERIISSSLHGLIISHSYNIPAVWAQFSGKLFGDGIKFQDYFESVGILNYIPTISQNKLTSSEIQNLFKNRPSLPETSNIESLQAGLLSVCPF
jgi:pyruvyltransferase